MLNRQLLTASAVFRSAAATRSLSYAASSAVPLRSSILKVNSAVKVSQAAPTALRWLSQSASVGNAAEATASSPQDSGVSQSVDPNAPNFVLPEGHTLRRTSTGEFKMRPPKDDTFASLKGSINYDVWKSLTSAPFKYSTMSSVQESVLHLLPELASSIGANAEPMPDGLGRDMLVKARTGTGKTIAFLVPALEARIRSMVDVRRGIFTKPWQDMLSRHRSDFDYENLDKHGRDNLVKQFANNTVGVLILSPTRELATQIAEEAKKLLTHEPSMRVQLLVGGVNRSRQIDDWRKSRPDVVVATPGRALDLLNDIGMIREAMSACRTLVLDEADTLLALGFQNDLQAILKHLPAKEDRQTMLFSATVSKAIQAVARDSLERNYRFIDCVPAGEDNVHKHIPQYATVLDSVAEQIPHILRLVAHDQLTNVGKSKIIIFAPTTKMTQLIAQVVRDSRRNMPAGRSSEVYEIHSRKDQKARFNTSDRFRKDQSGASILVTSDVSARGVDYPGTTRVIQIGAPSDKDQYIHRIGRTGRAGASGRSDIVLQTWERGFLHFQLDDLPIQNLSCDSLNEEVQTLCRRFDESPHEFAVPVDMNKERSPRRTSKYDRAPPRRITGLQGPLTDKYLTSTQSPLIQDSMSKLDSDEVREVFASLLGFYVTMTEELRTSKSNVLEGLKKWAVEAGGLERAPFISAAFAQKLGFSSDSHSRGSNGGSRNRDRSGSSSSSFGRGRFSKDGGGGRSFGERAPRSDSAFGERAPRSDSAFGERAPRSDSAFGERAPRSDSAFGERAPRSDSAFGERAPRGDSAFGERAPRGGRDFGDRAPRGGRDFGDRNSRSDNRSFGNSRSPRGSGFNRGGDRSSSGPSYS